MPSGRRRDAATGMAKQLALSREEWKSTGPVCDRFAIATSRGTAPNAVFWRSRRPQFGVEDHWDGARAARALSNERSETRVRHGPGRARGVWRPSPWPLPRELSAPSTGTGRPKTVTEADHHLFCLLTMNHQPLHINEVYAKRSQHGRNVVVGTLVYSLAVTEFKRLVLVPRKPE